MTSRLLPGAALVLLGCRAAGVYQTSGVQTSGVDDAATMPVAFADGGEAKAGGGAVDGGAAARADAPGTERAGGEICGDGLDNDSNGAVDDGCSCVPGQMQSCFDGPKQLAGVGVCSRGQQVCSGSVDGEFGVWGPCKGAMLPADDVCGDGLDNDCDGVADQGCLCQPGAERVCFTGPTNARGQGLCSDGTQTCVAKGTTSEWGPCEGEVLPAPELCDGQDRDCDGVPNTGCDCTIGGQRACYGGPPGTAGVGICRAGMQTCVAGRGSRGSLWGPCAGEVLPEAEACDGMDRACSGFPGAGCACILGASQLCYTGPMGTAGVGECRAGRQGCVMAGGSVGWSACEGDVVPRPDVCDGVDHDCDGVIDTGCRCALGTSRACYSGPDGTAGIGICRSGTQSCVPGDGGAGSVWTACAGEVLPAHELCGNAVDDDCNGATDETCGGTITCPADVTVPAGAPVQVAVTGTQLVAYAWTITDGPAGGITTSTWAPTPPTSITEQFRPFIVGRYTIGVSATDTTGATRSCSFHVTALPHGLRVQLRWDGAGDIDLHLHDSAPTPWYTGDDCYFSNRMPIWGASLDFDNVIASGPENITVDAPAVGSAYTVGVHNYARGSDRIATVDIFCGDTMSTVPIATFASRALTGTSSGSCSTNDFWEVATVVFSTPSTCTIAPIDLYEPSNTACSSGP